MTLGERIKQLRDEKGITQLKLARLCGVNRNSIYMYERNNVQPRQEVLSRIANALDVSIDYLLGNSDDPNDKTSTCNSDNMTKAILKNIDMDKIIREAIEETLKEVMKPSKEEQLFFAMKELFLKEGFDSIHTSISFDEDENVQESIYLVESDHVCYKFKSEDIKELLDATQAFFGFQFKKIIPRAIETINKIEK